MNLKVAEDKFLSSQAEAQSLKSRLKRLATESQQHQTYDTSKEDRRKLAKFESSLKKREAEITRLKTVVEDSNMLHVENVDKLEERLRKRDARGEQQIQKLTKFIDEQLQEI